MSSIPTCICPFPGVFPPELIDGVLDHLHGDIDSLRACALTSSAWLSTTRYHLFSNVSFESEASVFRWTQAFSAPSGIPTYVQDLHLSCVSLLDDVSNGPFDLSAFTRLKGLYIGGSEVTPIRHRGPSGGYFQRIAHLPSTSLRTLSLYCSLMPVPGVFSVIRHFPRLDNLHLKCIAVVSSGDTVDTKTEASPSFRGTLTLASHLSYKPLVSNLLAFPGGIHFTRLDLAVLWGDELPHLRELVDACSHTITSLRINIDLGKLNPPIRGVPSFIPSPDLALLANPDNELPSLFNLAKLHNLSELHVTLHAMRLPVASLTEMLSSIADAESRLCDLTFSLFTWRRWRFAEPDVERWDVVDQALMQLSRVIKERLKVDLVIQVIVNVLEYGPHDVRDILPRLGAEGLVRLKRDGDSTLELSS
jgi:hypothetical protein